HTGMAAEYYEAKAPAVPGDKNAEREQQGASTASAKTVCRGKPQRATEDIALLATRCKRQRRKTCQTKQEGKQGIHLAPSPEATVIGACRFALRTDCSNTPCRAVRIASTAWSKASAQHMRSTPAKTQSPSARLCHSGRFVVSALRTGSRNSSADAAHNCSTQADLAGRSRACSNANAQTMKNEWISQSPRPSIGYGNRRLAHRNAVM